MRISVLLIPVCAALVAGVSSAGLPVYSLVGSFDLPANVSAFDTLPDGRLVTFVASDFWIQDAPNSSDWSRAGSLAPGVISPFGASFVRASPDGMTLAIGDNNFGIGAAVHTLAFASLDPMSASATTAWPASNVDAHWADDNTLYIAGAGASGEVREIDLSASSSRVVVTNIGLSAGGITSDGSHLYAGNGFDLGGGASNTGEVRAFAWSAITSAATPIDFAAGAPVADALSGASLDFDPLGNLLIGGGDVFGGSGDFGSAAVVDGDAVSAALLGGPIAPDASELRLTPLSPDHSYFTRFNAATNELLVTFFDNTSFEPGATVFRYAVPGPGATVLLLVLLRPGRWRNTESTEGHGGGMESGK